MPFTAIIEKRALNDIQTAIDYYDKQRVGLGKKFNNALDNHLTSLTNNPFFQLRYEGYRALPIKKFPYLILFYIQEDSNEVFILAVFNVKQNITKLPQ